jgi:hypothetical protein
MLSAYMYVYIRGGKDSYETLADGRIVSLHPGSLLAPFGKVADLCVCMHACMYVCVYVCLYND